MHWKTGFKTVSQALNQTIGIDIGTTNFRVSVTGQGIVFNEPNVVAIDRTKNTVIALGNEAWEMIGRVPESITIKRPFFEGVMSEYTVMEAMFRYIFHKVLGKFFLFRPVVMVSVASDASKIERQALNEALISAGARQVYLIDAPLAAAIGAGLPVANLSGSMILHIGGGVSEIAVVSLGRIVSFKSIREGGESYDQAILKYIKQKYSFKISRQTSKRLKENHLTLLNQESTPFSVKGKDMKLNVPREIMLLPAEITPALQLPLKHLSKLIHELLEEIPAELAGDTIDKGVILTGGTALLSGLDYYLAQVLGIPVSLTEESDLCVIKGVSIALDHLDLYRQSLAYGYL